MIHPAYRDNFDLWNRWSVLNTLRDGIPGSQAFKSVAASNSTFDLLLKAYSEPHRTYHTLSHLRSCLRILDEVRNFLNAPELALAETVLWFHDAIYDPQKSDNEERSADLATAFLHSVGMSESFQTEVARYIIATKHGTAYTQRIKPDSTEFPLAVVLDTDLAVLAGSPIEYDMYSYAIRKEYSFVDDDTFRAGRRKILRAFLDRPFIYVASITGDRQEAIARDNIKRELSFQERVR